MLSQAPPDAQFTPHWQVVDKMWNACFWVDDIDALYAEYQQSGGAIDYTLSVKPYGMKEFGVQDLDGHDLACGQPTEAS